MLSASQVRGRTHPRRSRTRAPSPARARCLRSTPSPPCTRTSHRAQLQGHTTATASSTRSRSPARASASADRVRPSPAYAWARPARTPALTRDFARCAVNFPPISSLTAGRDSASPSLPSLASSTGSSSARPLLPGINQLSPPLGTSPLHSPLHAPYRNPMSVSAMLSGPPRDHTISVYASQQQGGQTAGQQIGRASCRERVS